MKSLSAVSFHVGLTMVCGLALSSSVFVNRAQADQWDKKTIITVDQPIQVRDRLLQPGTYVFRLLDSNSDRHIVQIFNSDQSHIIDTILAIPNYRLQPTGKSQFLFYETPPGTAHALHAWFYPGDNYGQEFPYPKNPIVLQAAVTHTEAAPPPPPPVTPAPQPEVTPAQPETQAQQPEPVTPPNEMAEVTPPPAPAETPAPAPQPAPQNLPKTGSLYPVIGLIGLLSLGLYSITRLTRSA